MFSPPLHDFGTTFKNIIFVMHAHFTSPRRFIQPIFSYALRQNIQTVIVLGNLIFSASAVNIFVLARVVNAISKKSRRKWARMEKIRHK